MEPRSSYPPDIGFEKHFTTRIDDILRLIAETDKRYDMQFREQEKAVTAAQQSANIATTKAETSTNDRLKLLNESKATIEKAQDNFAPKIGTDKELNMHSDRISKIEERLGKLEGVGSGRHDSWILLLGAVLLISQFVGIGVALWNLKK